MVLFPIARPRLESSTLSPRHIKALFLVAALILGASQFSFAQDAPRTPLADSQDSAAVSSAAAGLSSTDAALPAAQPTDAQAPGAQLPAAQSDTAGGASPQNPPPQPKRILGVMPNFRAVSAGVIPPPPTPKQAFIVATRNSFDYSSFIFVGITSSFAEWTGAHPQLGEGLAGYGRYYWRGFVDKADGNYWVIFALPTVFHEDERYYSMGKGGFWKRLVYSSTRILITPDYHGHEHLQRLGSLGPGHFPRHLPGLLPQRYPHGRSHRR